MQREISARRVAHALVETFSPLGILTFQNNGVYSGQETPHFHFHVVPRQPGSEWGIGPPQLATFEAAGRPRGTPHDPAEDAARKAMEHQKLKRLEVSSKSEKIDGVTWVSVKISDTGKGIPADSLDHLWNLFQPSDGGLGFGMWWMRTFIERQGGSIECQSKPDKGSTFIIRLPV